jgi:hypothetical protein
MIMQNSSPPKRAIVSGSLVHPRNLARIDVMLARNPTSLISLIAWLKTKNPKHKYSFIEIDGTCLFSQYLEALGYDRDPVNEHTNPVWTFLHRNHVAIASCTPWTYGAALERALDKEARCYHQSCASVVAE